MELVLASGFQQNALLFFAVTAAVAAGSSLVVFLGCFYWFRREQRRWQKKVLDAIAASGLVLEERLLIGRDASGRGELVARFKVNQGREAVVSVLESDGKRFIHVVGELSARERTKMVRYLKSEGFMS